MENQNSSNQDQPRPIPFGTSPQSISPQPIQPGVPIALRPINTPPSLNLTPPPPPINNNRPALEEEGGGGFKKIILIALGALGVFLIIFIVLFFVLPRLSGKNQKVTLIYWGLWEDPPIFAGVIDEFQKQHPNIEIKYVKKDIKAEGKYIERISTRIQNGTGPDILRFHVSWIPELKSLLLPFPSSVVNQINYDNYYTTVQEDAKENAAYYGVPIETDNLALFLNDDLFNKAGVTSPPSTWDDLVKVSRQLTVKDESGNIQTAGVAMGSYDNVEHASDILSLLFIQNGADMKDLAGVNKQNAEDALSFYTSFSMGDDSVWGKNLDNSKLAFTKGNLAMYFGYSWDIFDIKAINPDLNYRIVEVPKLPSKSTTVASYWLEGVSVKTKHQKEAFEFIKFLSENTTLEKLYTAEAKTRLFGEIYPKKDMKSLLASNEHLATFVKQADDANSTFFASNTYDDAMVTALNAYLANAIRSVEDGSVSVTSAIETLSQGVSQVLGRYSNPIKK